MKLDGVEYAIEYWDVDRPVDYLKNARKITEKAVDKVAASIREYGFLQACVVDKDGALVVGHVRRRAAKKLGMAKIPVLVAAHLTPGQAKAYRLMDNRSNDEVMFDLEMVGAELLDLKEIGVDLGLTGFDPREIDKILPHENTAADEAPSLPQFPTTRPGDMWVMGERQHRLICGSSADPKVIAIVAGKDKADALWTDPPYGVEYVGKTKDKLTIKGDGADGIEALMVDALSGLTPHMQAGSPFYIAHPPGALYLAFGRAVQTVGWRIHQNLVWVKDSMVLGHSDYHFMHEPILYGFTPGDGRPGRGKHSGSKWYGDHAQTSVFTIARPKRSEEHPTMKPVELIQRCLGNSVPWNGTVFDLFTGSGSTLAAAAVMERRFLGVEIDPRYVDVAVIRWQNLTGQQATLDGHGATFAHVREGRLLGAEDELKESILAAEESKPEATVNA